MDVWEREIGQEEDENIIQAIIGIETARRLKREWAVRVAEAASDLSTITRAAGHKYTVLAHLQRLDSEDSAIFSHAITDMRRTQINIAKYLKTPIHLVRGSTSLTAEDFSSLLESLKSILLSRYRDRIFEFSFDEDFHERLVWHALESIVHFCAFAAAQTRAGNFNNSDGINTLIDLYALQQDFVDVVSNYGNFDNLPATQDFITAYNGLLADASTASSDLLTSVEAQQDINAWLSLPTGELPEGSVLVAIIDVQPPVNLAVDAPFSITYQITSRVDSNRVQEDFILSVDTSTPSPWEFSLDASQITLDADGGTGTVVLNVTPRSGAVSAQFLLSVAAARNQAGINFTHTSPTYQIGLPPVTEEILQWISPALDESGHIQYTQFMFQLGAGQVSFEVGVINTSDEGLTQRYEISHHVLPPAGEEALWTPASAAPATQEVDVADGDTETLVLNITGPNPPAIGTQGSIVVVATLLLEGPLPPDEPSVTTLDVVYEVLS